MRSKEFIVSHRFKIVFVWISILTTLSLGFYQLNKRTKYWNRHVLNIMQPVSISPSHKINVPLEALFPGRIPGFNANDSSLVLYHFWATWCAPCRAEIPTLNGLQRHFGSKLKIITIAVDENKDDISRFFAGTSPQFEVLWDQEQKVSFDFGVQKFPETFLLLRDSNQMLRFSGARDWNSQEAIDYFQQILSQSS